MAPGVWTFVALVFGGEWRNTHQYFNSVTSGVPDNFEIPNNCAFNIEYFYPS